MRIHKVKAKDKGQWHYWFAWYPIVMGDELVWLETVQRRGKERAVATYDHGMVLKETIIEYEYQ